MSLYEPCRARREDDPARLSSEAARAAVRNWRTCWHAVGFLLVLVSVVMVCPATLAIPTETHPRRLFVNEEPTAHQHRSGGIPELLS